MACEISSDIIELLKNAVDDDIDEYDVNLENNDEGQGFVGEVIFITTIHKITGIKKDLILKQVKNVDPKTVEECAVYFNTEIKFYGKVWPFMNNFYKSVSGKDLNIVPKFFGASSTGRQGLMLENIKPQGFNLYDKTKPFDDDHLRLIFKTYGIYHGVGMAVRKQNREKYYDLVDHELNYFITAYKEGGWFTKDFIANIQRITEFFDPIHEEEILKKLSLYEKTGPSILREVLEGDISNAVIIHGDCWSNNLMFKYDNQGKVQDMKLLDFQLMSYGSPVFDLSYCLYSGASEDTLNKLDDYLEIYHSSLRNTLKQFNLEAEIVYPLKTFKKDWKKYCKYGFPLGLRVWKLKLVDPNEIPDFSKDAELVTFNVAKCFEDDYKKRIRELVFHLHNNDFI